MGTNCVKDIFAPESNMDKEEHKSYIKIADFHELDRNGDGFVDKDELMKYLSTTSNLTRKEQSKLAKEFIKDLDENDDNKIDINEWQSYWVKSGWLPSPSKCRAFFKKLRVNNDPKSWDPIIVSFYDYIKHDSIVRQGVNQMIMGAKKEHGADTPIQSIVQMCSALNTIIKLIPQYSNPETNDDPLIGVPFAALFADVATNYSGHSMFLHPEFNKRLSLILNAWMKYLDSSSSFGVDNNGDWLSDDAKKSYQFEEYETELKEAPYWSSWNKFFTRKLLPNMRPNCGENDDSVMQLCNDGVEVRYRFGIGHQHTFWLKNMPYSLLDIFGKKYAKYADIFVGGSIFQSYLDPFNYHRYHVPVDGVVVARDVMEGAYFPQLVWKHDVDDEGAGTMSLPWLLHVNARGIFIIDTKGYANIGLVCMVAIGMGEVSSVLFYPEIGDKVKKGDLFGAFQFGGSSIAVINEDLSKYDKKLIYHKKFKPQPSNDEHIEFLVAQVMANISNTK